MYTSNYPLPLVHILETSITLYIINAHATPRICLLEHQNKMKLPILATLPVLAYCGEIVWDGRMNASTTVDHFDQCMSFQSLPT